MLPLEVVFDVPPAIVRGLATGALERVGGVVRETGSKQVVMWLREGAKVAGNSDLASGALKTLLNVSTGGLASVATGAIEAAVSNYRHKQIMQALNVIQGFAVVGAAAPIVGIAVQIASTLYLVRRISDLHKDIVNEFEQERRNRLESAIEYVEKIIPKLEGDRRNTAVEGVSREIIAARNDLRWKIDQILDSKRLSVEQIELASKLLLQATQLDTLHVHIYLESDQYQLAENLLNDGLVHYKHQTQTLVQDLLGSYPARFFNGCVGDADFLRYVLVEEWLREQTDVLLDLVIEKRKDFWNGDVNKTIGPNRRDLRGFTYVGHLEALSYAEQLIENFRRMEGFEAELKAIKKLGIPKSKWEQYQEEALAKAEINLAEHDDYVLLVDKDWLAEQSDSPAA